MLVVKFNSEENVLLPSIEKLSHQALPVHFPEVEDAIQKWMKNWEARNRFDDSVGSKLLTEFPGLIAPQIKIEDLQSFRLRMSQGTIESFNEFYLLNAGKVLYLLPGEFGYHEEICRRQGRAFRFWDGEKPDAPACLILSHPFAGDGNFHPAFEQIMDWCCKWGVDVQLDLAFWGLSKKPLYIDRFPCVKSITFSLSKTYNVGNFRLGFTYWRYPHVSMDLLHEWTYLNFFNAQLSVFLLEKFPVFDLIQWAGQIQVDVCKQLSISAANSYLFGNSPEARWSEYRRAGQDARIGIQELISQRIRNGMASN